MATTIKMPQLGESVTEGTIERWLVKEGDTVEQYDPLFEVVTDKVNAEVPAEVAGKVTKIMVGDGETVKVGTPLAEIAADGDAEPAGEPQAAAAEQAEEPQAEERQAEAAEAPQAEPAEPAEQPKAKAEPSEERQAEVAAQAQAAAGIQASAETGPESDAAARAAEAAAEQERPTSQGAAAQDGGPPAAATDGNVRMTPVVRRLVREHGIDVSQLRGTGAGGRITREDVLGFIQQRESAPAAGAPAPEAGAAAAEAPAAEPKAAPSPEAPAAPQAPAYRPPAAVAVGPAGADREMPLSQMRRGIAAHMVKAKQTIPHAYTIVEADMSNVVRWREAHNEAYRAREGANLSYVAVVVKAVTETLRDHPTLNSQFAEDRVILKQRMNIGIAIAVDNGLIVPVIHDADQLSVSGVSKRIADLAARARSNKLRLDDLQGGTFTVNNTGWFGSVSSMPIVNAPEVAILSMEAIVKRPRVLEVDGTDVIAVRHMMNLCCSFDHRVLDGAQVGAFLADVRARLEEWSTETAVG